VEGHEDEGHHRHRHRRAHHHHRRSDRQGVSRVESSRVGVSQVSLRTLPCPPCPVSLYHCITFLRLAASCWNAEHLARSRDVKFESSVQVGLGDAAPLVIEFVSLR
jgi:hypothetical protein